MLPSTFKKCIAVFGSVFVFTGLAAVYISLLSQSKDSLLVKLTIPLFGVHMACWMLAGMVAKHVWDAYKVNPNEITIDPTKIIGPLVISPMVFYPIYSLWTSKDSNILFVLNLIAFQNGFFWQTVFDAARPVALPPGQISTQDDASKVNKAES